MPKNSLHTFLLLHSRQTLPLATLEILHFSIFLSPLIHISAPLRAGRVSTEAATPVSKVPIMKEGADWGQEEDDV